MNGNLNSKSPLLWFGMLTFIAVVLLCMVNISHIGGTGASQPLVLTSVMMVGLALIVGLVILLLIFFKATETEDKTQALALPSGSIRALIALALVLMFVCMGVYLYQGVSGNGLEVTKQGLTRSQVDALKTQFSLVIEHPAASTNKPTAPNNSGNTPPGNTPPGTTPPGAGNTPAAAEPLFDVTYYPGRSKEADDLAKQMFTQLATVFVTVIGFYFGSSTAAAGVGTGVAAANAATGNTPTPTSGVPAALQEAKAMTHDAELDLARINTVYTQLPETSPDKNAVKTLLDNTQKTIDTIHAKVQAAMAAASKFGTASTDAENNASAADVIKARDEIKPLAATVKANADQASAKVPAAPKIS